MSSTTEVTYEDGLQRLEGIIERLEADDVPVGEMMNLLREGKGLEQALRGYLDACQAELSEIEAGKNLPEFTVIATSGPTGATRVVTSSIDGIDGGAQELDF